MTTSTRSVGVWRRSMPSSPGWTIPRAAHLRTLTRAPGPPERLDRRRRWLGLRHRLRRARPRARVGPQRQHPRARHGGVLEYRRPGLEVHAPRRGREVRRRRETQPQEGPRADGDGLRQRLRGANRDGRVRRSRPWTPFSRPRRTRARRSSSPTATASPTASTCASACGSRSWRPTAATGRSTATGRRVAAACTRSSCSTRWRRDPVEGVRVQRDPLQDALLHESGGGEDTPRGWRRRTSISAGVLPEHGGTVARGQPARTGRSGQPRRRRRCRGRRRAREQRAVHGARGMVRVAFECSE